MLRDRRAVLAKLAALGALAGGLVQARAADDYPSRPIRLIVPFAPAGPADIVARALAKPLGEALRQTVVGDNRAGGNAGIGAEAVAHAEPDGYTLLLATSAHATNVSLSKKVLRYDLLKDFAPVSEIAAFPLVLVTPTSRGIASVADVIARAKAGPGKLTYASGGNGGGSHLAAESFSLATGIKMTHVPYKGTGPAVMDTVAGQVDLMFASVASVLPHVQSGRLLALAATSPKRIANLQSVPTLSESGLHGFELESWFGLLAPAGTPPRVVELLNQQVGRILGTPEFLASLASDGGRAAHSSSEEFGRFIDSEVRRWGQVVRLTGATIE